MSAGETLVKVVSPGTHHLPQHLTQERLSPTVGNPQQEVQRPMHRHPHRRQQEARESPPPLSKDLRQGPRHRPASHQSPAHEHRTPQKEKPSESPKSHTAAHSRGGNIPLTVLERLGTGRESSELLPPTGGTRGDCITPGRVRSRSTAASMTKGTNPHFTADTELKKRQAQLAEARELAEMRKLAARAGPLAPPLPHSHHQSHTRPPRARNSATPQGQPTAGKPPPP
nr:uncharacterized protein LOC123762529 [Procambarus clarkii]